MRPVVLDASVAVKWFLDEPGVAAADEVLRDLLLRRRDFVVPELFFYEVLAVCARRHPNPGDFAAVDMPFLLSLPLTRAALSGSLAVGAARLTGQGLTGYDASYAALAEHVAGEWITFDRRAAQCLGHPPWVRVLAE